MTHPVVSQEEWTKARRDLLVREKEMTRARDRLNEARRALPWVRVEKDYRFDTPSGGKSLAELFDGRDQLFVYHFMLAPDWEEGCVGCSFLADHIDGALIHIQHGGVSVVAVSRAPMEKIKSYKARMGWKFPWVSAAGSDFNYDYQASFRDEDLASGAITYNYRDIPPIGELKDLHGLSVFAKNDKGEIFHTYSAYARGCEEIIGTLMLLDLVPNGRNEETTMGWVRRHDQYPDAPNTESCCH
jgi:predicted dithiol-disulfide oxidoreductase (DUF899 family)